MNNNRLLTLFTTATVTAVAMIACNHKASADKPQSNGSATAISNIAVDPPTVFNDSNLDEQAGIWADSVMKTLDLRRRIAQLFVPRLDITNNATGYQKLKRVISQEKMGGFLLGKGSLECYADLINKGQAQAEVPLLITLDGEWGLSMRIPGTPRFPHNIALGAADDEALMEAYGEEMARECRLMGIQVNFAPDLDVNANPNNPVIGYRSFGENPQMVGRLGVAYCRGMAKGGVMPVGKHFPGHGDTSVDSHKALPTIDHSISTLRNVDLRPFIMAVNAGMPAVMVGHLKVPALDKSGTPASLSRAITTSWLRDSLGFDGLIFTDALAMKGATVKNENNCVSAFLAGADVLLGSSDPVSDLNAVEAAVKAGKIDKSEIDRRCRNLLKYKYKLGLNKKPRIDVKGLSARLNTAHADSIISQMSRKVLTLLKNDGNTVPVKAESPKKRVVVVNLGMKGNDDFGKRCTALSDAKVYNVDAAIVPAEIMKAVKNADVAIVAVYNNTDKTLHAFKSIGAERGCIGVFFINPYKMTKFDRLESLQSMLLAYDDIPQLRLVAADAVFGLQPITGKLPVNLPGIADLNAGLRL